MTSEDLVEMYESAPDPPLLAGLSEVDWSAVEHAHGRADDRPPDLAVAFELVHYYVPPVAFTADGHRLLRFSHDRPQPGDPDVGGKSPARGVITVETWDATPRREDASRPEEK